MKILFINNFFNPGGSTLACLEPSKLLKDNGHELEFIGCYDGIKRKDFESIGKVHFLNVDKLFEYKSSDIIEICNSFNPDIIHIMIPGHEYPDYFNYLPYNCKKICTVLCGQKVGFDHTKFDTVIFPSKYGGSLSNINNGKIIRYGINDIEYKPIVTDKIVFGRISAFCPSKQILATIYCANACKDKQFIIAGEVQDKNYFTSLVAHIKKHNIKNVRLEYNISEQRKQEILEEINVLHYPTSNEAFCYSILEGMRAGKAIISYYNSAIPELQHDNNLLLVSDNNLSSLIRETKNLSTDDVIKLGSKNRKVYEQFYSIEEYVRNLMNEYNR